MGYYYEQPPQDEKPPGCLDVLLITRAVFSILLWPVVAIVAVIIDVAVTFFLFTLHPVLALIPLAVTAGVLWLIARWDQNRNLPPDL